MIESDTVKLLRECDAGIRMGVSSINEVIDHAQKPNLKKALSGCKQAHEKLAGEVESALGRFGDSGKAPNPIAKSMSWIKTNVKLASEDSDATIADLMTDGCNMGVKSLQRYLNQYEAADEHAKGIAKSLIVLESRLCEDLREYL